MSDRKINAFTVLSTAQVGDKTKLFVLGVAADGSLGQATGTQITLVYSSTMLYYTATGAEGTVITISALAAMYIIGIWREGPIMYPVVSAPDSVSYIWDGANITLGLAAGPGERFAIEYRYP